MKKIKQPEIQKKRDWDDQTKRMELDRILATYEKNKTNNHSNQIHENPDRSGLNVLTNEYNKHKNQNANFLTINKTAKNDPKIQASKKDENNPLETGDFKSPIEKNHVDYLLQQRLTNKTSLESNILQTNS